MYSKDKDFLPPCPYCSDLSVHQRNKVIISHSGSEQLLAVCNISQEKAKLQVSTQNHPS